MKVKLLSRVRLLVTPWTAAYQAPPSMGFSRQEYWSGVPVPSPLTYMRRAQTVTCADRVVDQRPFSFLSLIFFLAPINPESRYFALSPVLSLINMALLVPRRLRILGQCLSSSNRQTPGTLVKCTGLGRGLRSCLSNGLLAEANATGSMGQVSSRSSQL